MVIRSWGVTVKAKLPSVKASIFKHESEIMCPGFVISRIMVKISRQQAKMYISPISIKVVDINEATAESLVLFAHKECILSNVNY